MGRAQSEEKAKSRGGSIDGFRRPTAANQLHSRTSKSKTLDRKVVAKAKPAIKSKAIAQPKAAPAVTIAKSHTKTADQARQKRAQKFAKSSLISKFGRSTKEVTEVKAEPVIPQQHSQPPMQREASEYSSNESNKEKSKSPKKKSTRRFMAFKFNKPKAKSVFASAFLVVLALGYLTYLNIPNLSLRVAASRADINATLPGYKPSGFGMSGPINYSQGLVTLNFSSNSDARSFAISERSSSWDSESLLANYVEKETPHYVTFQDKGLTIYIYDGSNATWVDGGIWYTIEGESQLNSDQLLKIAASM